MDVDAQEKFIAAQTEQLKRTQAIAKQLQELQEQYKQQTAQQQQMFKEFEEQQAAAVAPAAGMGAAAGGVGAGAAGEGGVSDADKFDIKGQRTKKRAAVNDRSGKNASDCDEEDGNGGSDDEQDSEERVPCDFPGCTKTFKICSTTAATMSNHNRRYHLEGNGVCVCVRVCVCACVRVCVCVWAHVSMFCVQLICVVVFVCR